MGLGRSWPGHKAFDSISLRLTHPFSHRPIHAILPTHMDRARRARYGVAATNGARS